MTYLWHRYRFLPYMELLFLHANLERRFGRMLMIRARLRAKAKLA